MGYAGAPTGKQSNCLTQDTPERLHAVGATTARPRGKRQSAREQFAKKTQDTPERPVGLARLPAGALRATATTVGVQAAGQAEEQVLTLRLRGSRENIAARSTEERQRFRYTICIPKMTLLGLDKVAISPEPCVKN